MYTTQTYTYTYTDICVYHSIKVPYCVFSIHSGGFLNFIVTQYIFILEKNVLAREPSSAYYIYKLHLSFLYESMEMIVQDRVKGERKKVLKNTLFNNN